MEELLEDISFQEGENGVCCSGTSPELFKLQVAGEPFVGEGDKMLEKEQTDEGW